MFGSTLAGVFLFFIFLMGVEVGNRLTQEQCDRHYNSEIDDINRSWELRAVEHNAGAYRFNQRTGEVKFCWKDEKWPLNRQCSKSPD